MTDADYTDNLALLTNIPAQIEFLQHRVTMYWNSVTKSMNISIPFIYIHKYTIYMYLYKFIFDYRVI